jgi:3-oxoacyl-[acyl-carrier-protein] synthase-3
MNDINQFPGALYDIQYYLPNQVVTNADLGAEFPHWNVDQVALRTGVFERRVCKSDETAYDLALIAVKKLLDKNQLSKASLDAIIFCTQSPDYLLPSNAFLLQRDLGLPKSALIFDYNLACSGYVYGLLMASSLLKVGIAKNILLVTGDTYSKYLHKEDRSTRMLFGDGASASWIGLNQEDNIEPMISTFDDFIFGSDGEGWDKFIIKSGGNRHPDTENLIDARDNKIYMDGLHVLNLVNDKVTKSIADLLHKNALTTSDIDQFMLHQASGLALDSVTRKLKISSNQTFRNLMNIGNTVSSSLPILLSDYFSSNTLPVGSRIIISGFGVGYSWGSLLATK